MPVTEITDALYTIKEYDGGSKIRFNRGTPQKVTLLKSSDNSCRLGPGTVIEVQQIGAGKVTFAGARGVTINSRGGLLSLNGQYAAGTLMCDGVDTWTLSGDIAA
jgi:hypothetical protein